MSLDAVHKKSEFPIPTGVFAQTVTSVHHYTDRLFKFRITRPASLRFRSGEFMMIGLPNAEKPVYRAYSVASNNACKTAFRVPGNRFGTRCIF